MENSKSLRELLFENIARCIYGVDADNPKLPDMGWKAALARQMGMNKNAVTDTLKQDHGAVFDAKLADFISDRRRQMHDDVDHLAFYEKELRGGERVLQLWLVDQITSGSQSQSTVWAHDPGELLALIVADDWPWEAQRDIKIRYDSSQARGSAGPDYEIRVRHVPYSAGRPVLDDVLEKARDLLARKGTKIDHSIKRD